MLRSLLTLDVLPGRYAVCRLSPDSEVPGWAMTGEFWSVTRTLQELSIVCPEDSAADGITSEVGWRILKCRGPLEFEAIGIMSAIAGPLADAGVSIFPIATYDTDHVLVHESRLDAAVAALTAHGHVVHE